jgi:hypothetical protein
MQAMKTKALLVLAGVIGGLWYLERRARAATPAGASTTPGSSAGICVEDEDGNMACGGDFDPRVTTPPVMPTGGFIPDVIRKPPLGASTPTSKPSSLPPRQTTFPGPRDWQSQLS